MITLKTSGEEEDEGGSFLYYRLSQDESWADEGRVCVFFLCYLTVGSERGFDCIDAMVCTATNV